MTPLVLPMSIAVRVPARPAPLHVDPRLLGDGAFGCNACRCLDGERPSLLGYCAECEANRLSVVRAPRECAVDGCDYEVYPPDPCPSCHGTSPTSCRECEGCRGVGVVDAHSKSPTCEDHCLEDVR